MENPSGDVTRCIRIHEVEVGYVLHAQDWELKKRSSVAADAFDRARKPFSPPQVTQRGPDALRDAADDPEVDEPDSSVLQDQQIPGVHVLLRDPGHASGPKREASSIKLDLV